MLLSELWRSFNGAQSAMVVEGPAGVHKCVCENIN